MRAMAQAMSRDPNRLTYGGGPAAERDRRAPAGNTGAVGMKARGQMVPIARARVPKRTGSAEAPMASPTGHVWNSGLT